MTGVRAEVEIEGSEQCVAAEASEGRRMRIESWVMSTEFVQDVSSTDPIHDDEFTKLFQSGNRTVYRRTVSDCPDCICLTLYSSEYPIHEAYLEDGVLSVVLYVENRERLKSLVTALGKYADTVRLRNVYVDRFDNDHKSRKNVLVNLDRLTERQLEVLNVGHEMGYYEVPKQVTLDDVADELELSRPTVVQHLSVAEQKIMDCIQSN